jgi:tetraacyldisaccharide 4'-kinase
MASRETTYTVKPTTEEYFLDILSGRRRGPAAGALRLLLCAAEYPYAGAMRVRNCLYDRHILQIQRLPRPTISVGNLTTGGTGKTPLVCWLVAALRCAGHSPAVLLRGYKSAAGESDEQILIANSCPQIAVVANADRTAGAMQALASHSDTDLFILDDAMQHRRVDRDVEIVLISAKDPWGMNHILPRGLLRESPDGIRRADAVIITHANEATSDELVEIETTVRRHHPQVLVCRADHVLGTLIPADNSPDLPMSTLSELPYFVACGIGQPRSFISTLLIHAPHRLGHRFFPDHHPFTDADLSAITKQAIEIGASAIVVTEKDWTKLSHLTTISNSRLPIYRTRLTLHFWDGGGQKILDLIQDRSRNR